MYATANQVARGEQYATRDDAEKANDAMSYEWKFGRSCSPVTGTLGVSPSAPFSVRS